MASYRDRLSHHLSVGEKKRIAIATVLSMNPSNLILDEPSDGLDPRTIMMDDGRVVVDGMTSEILEDEKFLNEHGLEKW